MKKIVLKKNMEEKNCNPFPEKYYNVNNHQQYVNMIFLNETYEHDKEIQKEIEKKINGYIQQDKKKDRIGDFITLQDTLEILVCSKLICKYCSCKVKLLYKFKKEDQQWTLDRIDNTMPHTKDNVVVCCLKCNLKRGRMEMDKFNFTKKLHIVKI